MSLSKRAGEIKKLIDKKKCSGVVDLILKDPKVLGVLVPGLEKYGVTVLMFLGSYEEGNLSDKDWTRLLKVVKQVDLLKRDEFGETFIHGLAKMGYISPYWLRKFVLKAGKEVLELRDVSSDSYPRIHRHTSCAVPYDP